jgi:hypothetical protein
MKLSICSFPFFAKALTRQFLPENLNSTPANVTAPAIEALESLRLHQRTPTANPSECYAMIAETQGGSLPW